MKSKLIKCKTCGADISKTAKTCPSCGAKNKANSFTGFLAAFMIIIGAILIGVGVSNGGESTESGNNSTITKAEFEALQTGMTYEQCVEIIGGEGEMSSESTVGNINMAIYTWKGNGNLASNANATFQNGKLTAKAQLGLE